MAPLKLADDTDISGVLHRYLSEVVCRVLTTLSPKVSLKPIIVIPACVANCAFGNQSWHGCAELCLRLSGLPR